MASAQGSGNYQPAQDQYTTAWLESLDELKARYEAEEVHKHDAFLAETKNLETLIEEKRRYLCSDPSNVSGEGRQRSCDSLIEVVQRLVELRSSVEVSKSRRLEAHQTRLLQHFDSYSLLFPEPAVGDRVS
jgi:hypothetical protein